MFLCIRWFHSIHCKPFESSALDLDLDVMHELSFRSSGLGGCLFSLETLAPRRFKQSREKSWACFLNPEPFWEIWTQDTDGEAIPQFTKHAFDDVASMYRFSCLSTTSKSLPQPLPRDCVLSLLFCPVFIYNFKVFFFIMIKLVEFGRWREDKYLKSLPSVPTIPLWTIKTSLKLV